MVYFWAEISSHVQKVRTDLFIEYTVEIFLARRSQNAQNVIQLVQVYQSQGQSQEQRQGKPQG